MRKTMIQFLVLLVLIGCGSEVPSGNSNDPNAANKTTSLSFSERLVNLSPRSHWQSAPRVETGDSLTSTWSIVARFTPTTASGSQRLYELGGYNSPDGNGVSLEWGDNLTVSCVTWSGASVVSSAVATLNKETTAVCVYDSGTLRLYIDGRFEIERTGVSYFETTGNAGIGRSPHNGSTYDLQGSITDVATYRKALSASEISGLQ